MKPNSEQRAPNYKRRYAMSKRQRTGMALAGLLAAAFLIWFERIPVKLGWERQPESEEQQKAYDIEKYHAKSFHVVNVIDGDTIDIGIPDSEYIFTRVRLWGVDTPETKDPNLPVQYFGPEATNFTTKLALRKQAPEGLVTIYLDTTKRTRDKYDRLLAYVQLPDGRFLNEVLLSEGFAYADLRFRHSFYNKYQQLEAAARSLKKGLWEKVTRQQLPEWLQRERPNLLLSKKP
jgi:endonuclease YncB( thermonuclease family)